LPCSCGISITSSASAPGAIYRQAGLAGAARNFAELFEQLDLAALEGALPALYVRP
jgi:hypothetical protein